MKEVKNVVKKKKDSFSTMFLKAMFGLTLLIGLFFYLFGNDFSEIKKKYPESKKFESIDNTSWVLVENNSNKINIYDEDSKSFILKKWYDGDISSFGITFYKDYDNGVYEGVLINPGEYSKLLKFGDDLVQGKDPETQAETDKAVKEYGEEQDRLNNKSWVVCQSCTGKSCTRCFGRGYYYGRGN